MRDVVTTSAFRKGIKRMRKRGKDITKLEDIVECLVKDIALEEKHKPHLSLYLLHIERNLQG